MKHLPKGLRLMVGHMSNQETSAGIPRLWETKINKEQMFQRRKFSSRFFLPSPEHKGAWACLHQSTKVPGYHGPHKGDGHDDPGNNGTVFPSRTW